MKFKQKGQFGYIKFHRLFEVVKSLLLLALCIATYFIGVKTTGSNKNLLTFVAILGVLPMAKFAVNAIMFRKAGMCSRDLKNKIDATGIEGVLFDLYLTDYKNSYQLSAMYFKKNTLIALSEDTKTDIIEAEAHIKTVLSNVSVTNVTVKIFTDTDKFIERLTELSALESEDKNSNVVIENMLSVSL